MFWRIIPIQWWHKGKKKNICDGGALLYLPCRISLHRWVFMHGPYRKCEPRPLGENYTEQKSSASPVVQVTSLYNTFHQVSENAIRRSTSCKKVWFSYEFEHIQILLSSSIWLHSQIPRKKSSAKFGLCTGKGNRERENSGSFSEDVVSATAGRLWVGVWMCIWCSVSLEPTKPGLLSGLKAVTSGQVLAGWHCSPRAATVYEWVNFTVFGPHFQEIINSFSPETLKWSCTVGLGWSNFCPLWCFYWTSVPEKQKELVLVITSKCRSF